MAATDLTLTGNTEKPDTAQPSRDISSLTNQSFLEHTFELFREDHPTESWYVHGQERRTDVGSSTPIRLLKGFAGVRETWDDCTSIDARIIEIGEEWVRLDCLVDSENQVFQERVFQRGLLEGALPMRVGAYVLIRVFTSPGKIKHTFDDGEKLVRKKFFEDDSWFADLEDVSLDEMLR